MLVPLSAEDHIELPPAIWRAVNAYGIKISHRTYDAAGLNPDPAAEVRCRRPQGPNPKRRAGRRTASLVVR